MEYSQRVGSLTDDQQYEPAIGLLEFASIASGIMVTDALIKQSPVEILWARTISPGHWVVLFTGAVEEVREALDRGFDVGADEIVDDLFIANLHPSVPSVIREPAKDLDVDAVGIVEFRHIASAILAADIAVKTAEVDLIELRLGMHLGGKGLLTLTGATADVEDATEAAAAIGRDKGTLVKDIVIPRVTEELIPYLTGSE